MSSVRHLKEYNPSTTWGVFLKLVLQDLRKHGGAIISIKDFQGNIITQGSMVNMPDDEEPVKSFILYDTGNWGIYLTSMGILEKNSYIDLENKLIYSLMDVKKEDIEGVFDE